MPCDNWMKLEKENCRFFDLFYDVDIVNKQFKTFLKWTVCISIYGYEISITNTQKEDST